MADGAAYLRFETPNPGVATLTCLHTQRAISDASPALDETDLCRNYYIPGLATELEVTVRTEPALHPLEQRLSIDWLGDVVVDARGDALLPVLTHRSGGDGDDGKVG